MKRWLVVLFLGILLVGWVVAQGWNHAPTPVNSNSGQPDPHWNSGNKRIVRINDTVIALAPNVYAHDIMWRSIDDGTTWTEIDDAGLSSYSGVLITGPSNYIYHFYRNNDNNIYMVKFIYDDSPPSPVSIQSIAASSTGAYRSVSASVDSTGKLYVIYHAGDPDGVYIISSSDSGTTWDGPYTIQAPSTYNYYYPRIDIDVDNNILVVYSGGYGQSVQPTYFSKSTDGGETWPSRVTIAANNRPNPDILSTNASTYYIFTQSHDILDGCVFTKSIDGGATWSAFAQVEATISTSGYADPSSALGDDGTIYVSYRNDMVAGANNWREHISASSDGGATWSVVDDYDEAIMRTGTRSHLRYQTWWNYGGPLEWTWMQYDDSDTNRLIYYDINTDVNIYDIMSSSNCIDGQTRSCDTGQQGICSNGTENCSSGSWGSCIQDNQPTSEICGNGIDEDCSGSDLSCGTGSQLVFSYGFEDWGGDIASTPDYPYSTAYVSYCNEHTECTEVVTGYDGLTPYEGSYYFLEAFVGFSLTPSVPGIETCECAQCSTQIGIDAGECGQNDFDLDIEIPGDEFFMRARFAFSPGSWDAFGTMHTTTMAKMLRVDSGDSYSDIIFVMTHYQGGDYFISIYQENDGYKRVVNIGPNGPDDGVWHTLSIYINYAMNEVYLWYDVENESLQNAVNSYDFDVEGEDILGPAYIVATFGNWCANNPLAEGWLAIDGIELWDGMPGQSPPTCTHNADSDHNCKIERGELDNYINQWKGNPSISLIQVIESIGVWKAGKY
ncbi:MAG: sialidase family protein [archaeon]